MQLFSKIHKKVSLKLKFPNFVHPYLFHPLYMMLILVDKLIFSKTEIIFLLRDKLLPDFHHGFFRPGRSHDGNLAKACLSTKKIILFLRKLAYLHEIKQNEKHPFMLILVFYIQSTPFLGI